MFNNPAHLFKTIFVLSAFLFGSLGSNGSIHSQAKGQKSDTSFTIPESYSKYKKLEEGMTYHEVMKVLGGKGIRKKCRWGNEERPYVDILFHDGQTSSIFYRADYQYYRVEYSEVLKGLYDKLETGMTYETFIRLLEKKEGELPDAISKKPSEDAFSYEWGTPGGMNLKVKFLGGELKSKMKKGGFGGGSREDREEQDQPDGSSSSASFGYEEYEKLEEGMTYDEVVEVIGNEGKRKEYKWVMEDGSEVAVDFGDEEEVDHLDYDADYKNYEVEYSSVLAGLYDECDEATQINSDCVMTHEDFVNFIKEKDGKMPEMIQENPPEFAFSYSWKNPDDKKITIRFFNGVVESALWSNYAPIRRRNKRAEKAKDRGVERIPKENYEKLETGVPYEKAVEIFGREGIELKSSVSDKGVKRLKGFLEASVSNPDEATFYKWVNPDGSFILVITKDGIVKGKSNLGL